MGDGQWKIGNRKSRIGNRESEDMGPGFKSHGHKSVREYLGVCNAAQNRLTGNLTVQPTQQLCHTFQLGENIMIARQIPQVCRNHKLCLQLA